MLVLISNREIYSAYFPTGAKDADIGKRSISLYKTETFNIFCESRIIAIIEDTIIRSSAIKFNKIFEIRNGARIFD
jgi:hypothetical protein